MSNQVIKKIRAKYQHIPDMTGFLREMEEAGVTLDELAREMGWSNRELMRVIHLREAFIPSPDNAALSQGEAITCALGWDDEPPSKRELLEQLLKEIRQIRADVAATAAEMHATQRKTAQILSRWDSDGLPSVGRTM